MDGMDTINIYCLCQEMIRDLAVVEPTSPITAEIDMTSLNKLRPIIQRPGLFVPWLTLSHSAYFHIHHPATSAFHTLKKCGHLSLSRSRSKYARFVMAFLKESSNRRYRFPLVCDRQQRKPTSQISFCILRFSRETPKTDFPSVNYLFKMFHKRGVTNFR